MPNQYRLNQKKPHIVTLIIMCSFASMGAVVFAPALPTIAQYFHISPGQSQLTVTVFLLGYALGQLVYGPLANRYGRKTAFFIGIVISTIGSIISIISEPLHSFSFMISGRLLEALGSSAGLVISFTIVNDFYFPDQARRVISYMVLAFAIVPGMAVLIGGVLVAHFHWISCFYFLLIYGIALAIPVSRLVETATELQKHALKFATIHTAYKSAFKNTFFRNTSIFLSLTSMCVYVFSATAPFIAIHQLHLSAEQYGFIGLIPFVGTAIGSIVSGQLSSLLSARKLIKIGYGIEIISSLLLTAFFSFEFINLYVLISCGFLFMFGAALVMSNSTSIASSALTDKASASAVMNFINVGMAVCGTFILALMPGPQFIKLPAIFLIGLLVMFLFLRKMLLQKPD